MSKKEKRIDPHGSLTDVDVDAPLKPGWVRATQADVDFYNRHPDVVARMARITSTMDMKHEFEGPTLGISYGRRRRENLEESDFKRAKLGANYSKCTLAGIQDSEIRRIVKNYLDQIETVIGKGYGFVMAGAPGVGKSGAAAVVAMEAMRWAYSAYVCSHEELQELRFDNKQDMGDGQLVVERVRTADLLVLDNFNVDFITDKVFGPTRLEKLIRLRNTAQKATILTTQLHGKDFKSDEAMKSLYGVMQESMVTMTIDGDDLRQKKNAEMLRALGLEN